MPRFYFHATLNSDVIADEDGREFATLDDAITAARLDARHTVGGELQSGLDQIDLKVRIHDDRGQYLTTIAVTVEAWFSDWSTPDGGKLDVA